MKRWAFRLLYAVIIFVLSAIGIIMFNNAATQDEPTEPESEILD